MRPWLGLSTLAELNRAAEGISLQTASGKPVRFVPPAARSAYYEVQVFETGRVATRPDNLHDRFNALAWLAFPRTKAALNELHARQIPLEGGKRGRSRDLLTIFDEGGAIVRCGDPELERLARAARWRELFWEHRARVLEHMDILVVGHAVLEQALAPYPGLTCKVIFVAGGDPDAQAAARLAAHAPRGTPRDLPPIPVLGYPGWLPGSAHASFYDDARYFRPRATESAG